MVQSFLKPYAFIVVCLQQLSNEVFGLRTNALPNAVFKIVLSAGSAQKSVLHAVVCEGKSSAESKYIKNYRK